MPYNENIPGFMSLSELKVLESWAEEVPKNGIIVEIGAFMGRSSWAFAKSCDPSVTVYCVDKWPEYYHISKTMQTVMDAYKEGKTFDFQEFLEHTQDCPNIWPLHYHSTEAPWEEEIQIDLLFIDAKKKSPFIDEDIATWLPRLKAKGIIAGHDYIPERYPDVCTAVHRLEEKLQTPVHFYEGGSLWSVARAASAVENDFVRF